MLAVCDALIAAQNAVVAAESLGIGSCYIGDIMENAEVHQMTLQLPKYVFPVAMLVFGYPTDQQKKRKKPEPAVCCSRKRLSAAFRGCTAANVCAPLRRKILLGLDGSLLQPEVQF